MKNLLTILILLSFNCIYAQGNLQFNQVILWKLNSKIVYGAGTYGYDWLIQGTITVPIGKVWRIDAAGYNKPTTMHWALTLDNFLLFSRKQSPGGGIVNHLDINFPIWLPSGTYNYVASAAGGSSYSTIVYDGSSASIVEFNIIP